MPNEFDPFAVPDLTGEKWEKQAFVPYRDLRAKATERSNFSGDYDYELLRDIAEVSKEERIDPYVMIGIGLQESRLGEAPMYYAKGGSVFNLESNPLTKKQEKADYKKYMADGRELGFRAAGRRQAIRHAAMMFKRKRQIAKSLYGKKFGRRPTEAEIIQGWQGYGKIPFPKSFGRKRDLLGWRDIPHGEQVLEHAESLKRNVSIRAIVEGGG
jgi:hypothetical protein